MAQFALPTSDVVLAAGWSQGAGDGDASAFNELDEGFGVGRGSGSGPDDVTTYWSHSSSINAGTDLRTGLSAVTDPVSSTGHVYRTRSRKSATAGKTLDITITLYQDIVGVVATQTFTAVDSTTWTTRAGTLSAAEADAISGYANLRINTRPTWTGGGAARQCHETAHEFECPDAPAAERRSDGIMQPFYIAAPIAYLGV